MRRASLSLRSILSPSAWAFRPASLILSASLALFVPAAAAFGADGTAGPPGTPPGEAAAPPDASPGGTAGAPISSPGGVAGQPAAPGPVWDLDTVVATALARHPLVRQADAETRAAEARVGQAAAPYYPTIDLSGSYLHSRSTLRESGHAVTSDTEFAGGSASQVIADFGRRRSAKARAGALAEAAREDGMNVRDAVVFTVKVAYFDVLRADRLLGVTRETVRQRESLLGQAQAYYEAGIRARIDVARAEANLFQARAELAGAENGLRTSRVTLLSRMGVDGPEDFVLAGTPGAGTTPPGGLEEWIREAEENRPAIRALRSRVRAAESAVRNARAGHNPTIAGGATYGYAGEDSSFDPAYSLSVRMDIPIFNGFLVSNQVAEAEALLVSDRYALTDLRRQVRLEVERAALGIRQSIEQIAARKKEQEASAENLRLATGRYEVGAGDIIEITDALVQKARADASVVEALFDYDVFVARLLQAMGRHAP